MKKQLLLIQVVVKLMTNVHSSGDLVAQSHSDADADFKNTHDTTESTEINNIASKKAQPAITNRSVIERARATLRNKQPLTGLRQAAKDQLDTSRSLETKGNSVSTRLPAHLTWTHLKKDVLVGDREEMDRVSAVRREGETSKSRSTTIDWVEYSETPQ